MDELIKLKILTEAAHNHYNRAEAYKDILHGIMEESAKMDRFHPMSIDSFQEYLSDALTAIALMDLGEEDE